MLTLLKFMGSLQEEGANCKGYDAKILHSTLSTDVLSCLLCVSRSTVYLIVAYFRIYRFHFMTLRKRYEKIMKRNLFLHRENNVVK